MSNTHKKLTPQQLLNFYQQAEKLKTILRHSWLSNGVRQESVAEHTWMMSLMALILLPQMERELDAFKVFKMIVIHDLAEAVTKDIPVWQGVKNKAAKAKAEKQALVKMLECLDTETQNELLQIWEEYEARHSPESLFVKALDTLDVITQHNVAPLETWDDNDFLWQLSPLQDGFFDVDVFLRDIKNAIDTWSIKKVATANKLDKLDQAELQKRQNQK